MVKLLGGGVKFLFILFALVGTAKAQNQSLDFHMNQFMVYGGGQGPRSRSAVSGPSMWELEFTNKVTPKNSISVVLGMTWDKWAMSSKGYPQLLQSGDRNSKGYQYTDSQHPHSSPVVGLTFSDIISFSKDRKLTFFFAPRGEATAGPENSMHRESGDINPDVPLAHHLQDYFHLASTVAGTRFETKKTKLEASIFRGTEPDPVQVSLKMQRPDSLGVRMNHELGKGVAFGASYANLRVQHRLPEGSFESPEKESAYSSWVTTNNLIKSGRLSTAFVWGQLKHRGENLTLNSYLEEMVYQLGKGKFFGRLEVLQRTPEQLEVAVVDGQTGARWVKPVTVGYARSIVQMNGLDLDLGGSITKNYLPASFQSAYGGNPVGARIFLKLSWSKARTW